ncbi:MAG TPA: PEP-CTERM sorting domain-containing protein [Terriglobales bacterium]|nr:PEP-CTERM sorting domain-containing protein [Terriglobales bacterium]
MKIRLAVLVVLLVTFAASSAMADVVDFNGIPNGTVINNYYTGVTFSCVGCGLDGTGPNIYARGDGTSNVVSLFGTGLPFFDARWGGIRATFDTAQSVVAINAQAVLPPEYLGTPTNKPWLQAFDASNNLLGTVYYPINYGDAGFGTFQTLTFDAGSNVIAYVQFSSQHTSGPAVYGNFDDLTFRTQGTVPTVPEPAAIILFGTGASALLLRKRARK